MHMKPIMEGWRGYLKEDLFYLKDSGELGGPPDTGLSVEQISNDIIKYIKRQYPQNYHDAELQFKGGARVLKFTNFGSLDLRDQVIIDLVNKGWLSEPEVKRSLKAHRARTRFVDVSKSGKKTFIVIQLDAGGGAATAGGDYEDEMAALLNEKFKKQGKLYFAEKQGGSTNNPDIVIWTDENKTNKFVSFEAKTTLGADFGQFQLLHDPNTGTFVQKTQTSSPELVALFKVLVPEINKSCPVPSGDQSGELLKIGSRQNPFNFPKSLGEVTEDYYKEKQVDYIIINDAAYATTPAAQTKSGLPRFSQEVKDGYIRIRRKCHGKSYSTTAAIKFGSIGSSTNYYEDVIFNRTFP